MKRIGLFGKASRARVGRMLERHEARLAGGYDVTVFDLGGPLPEKVSLDLAVIFGGDGTILEAARYLAPRGVGAIGVNLGKFGFLAGCTVADCPTVLEAALEGRIECVERMMLACEVTSDGAAAERLTALNDIVVTASAPARMIGIRLAINEAPVASFDGDGLIVSSATGSTGYNLSSGGPIVTPGQDVIMLSPLAPHTLSIRPMVIGGGEVVDVEVAVRRGDVAVTADGQDARVIKSGDRVRVARAPYRFRLYEGPGWSFYKVLTNKLRWGEEPNYANGSH